MENERKKKYSILYDETSGNSFGHHDNYGEFLCDHDDLGIAKQNLVRIKEHYELYKALNESPPYDIPYNKIDKYKENKLKEAIAANKPWLVIEQKLYCISQNQRIDEKQRKKYKPEDLEYRADRYKSSYYLKLLVDGGGEWQLHAPWCGYFETLHAAYIEVNTDDNDMRVEFN